MAIPSPFHPLPHPLPPPVPASLFFFGWRQAAESLNILQDLEPDFVVLYDPDAAFVRTLEAYQAGRAHNRPPLTVYFMLYEQSVEEQRWPLFLELKKKRQDKYVKL